MTQLLPAEREATLSTICSVMARVFGVLDTSITEATQPSDITRWDSLNMVIVAIGLERRLGRPVATASCVGAASVGALLDVLCAPVGQGKDQ